MAFKKRKDMNTAEKFVEMTDIVKTFGDGIWGDKYNEWLDKSDKKVNPKSFAGKFLKVSFWISILLSFAGFAFWIFELNTHFYNF